MANKFSVGIDIGTYQVKVVIAENNASNGGEAPHIIGTGFAESKGLRHGYIININDVSRCIKIAVRQAEKVAKVRVKKAYISIGGIGLSSIVTKGSIMTERAETEMTDVDVENAMLAAESELPAGTLLNKTIIHPIPLSYRVDDQPLMGRPNGIHGSKLEAKVLFVLSLKQHLNDIIEAVENADIDVIDVMASPLAASLVSLSKSQKIAGCVLVNIGSETVSMVVYENNIPISLEVFPTGSTDITNDIALGFRIPIDEAENIKMGAVPETRYPKKKLDDIITGKLSDIFNLVEVHLKKIGRSGLLPAGIILTGGGSGIQTVEDIARASLKLPSKIASANFLSHAKGSEMKDASWSVAYGLTLWGMTSADDTGIHITRENTFGFIKNILTWLKQFLP